MKSKSFDSPKAQQGTSHEGVPEQFVPSHMRLFASYPRDQFDGLLRGEGVHGLIDWAEKSVYGMNADALVTKLERQEKV